MSKNLSHLTFKKGVKNNLFEKLGEAAKADGSPSVSDLEKLAKEFLIGTANTFGTASFYDFMKPENKGKKVYVCNGTACLCAGTQEKLQETLQQHFNADEIGHMTCLGRCHENGAFHYNGHNYSAKSDDEIGEIISSKKAAGDSYNVGGTHAFLTEPFSGVKDYYALLKDVLKRDRDSVLEEIKTAHIRGRGGAGFPKGFKLESCKN